MIPRLGVSTISDSAQVTVTAITPGSAAEQAGLQAGDVLVRVGDVTVQGDEWGGEFRARYAAAEGRSIPIVVRREGAERTFTARIRLEPAISGSLDFAPNPSAKAVRVRNGILRGR